MIQQLLTWMAAGTLTALILYLSWKLLLERKNGEASGLDLLTGVFDAVVLLDKQGTIQYINPAAEHMLKYKLRSARGKKIDDLFSLVDSSSRAVLTEYFDFPLAASRKLLKECLLIGSSQKGLSVEAVLQPRQTDGEPSEEYLLVLRDLTESQALQSRLSYLETHDSLTRLLNRKAFENHLRTAMNEARYHESRHVYCHLSLDQYRLINDAMGHNASDEMLIQVAEIIKRQLNATEHHIMRLDNSQFGVLIKNCIPSEGLRLMDQIRESINARPLSWADADHEITASVGFVLIYKSTASTFRIYSAADAACRVARDKGGNQIQVYRADDKQIQKQHGHIRWAGKVRQAFKENNFRLFAQPIHPLPEKKFAKPYYHYEVLIRLYNERGEPVSPQEFIPAAEYYSMMPEIDKWVIREVLRQLKQVTQTVPLPVFSVNLSGQSLDEEGFLKYVLQEIKSAGVRPQMICFEITETVAINNLNLATDFVTKLKQLGCSFALDDFGTGTSSFEYLNNLAFDYLKIDGSFIRDIMHDDVQKSMVESINQVGHLKGVETIAEFVENDDIIKELRKIGLDYGQGYGISRPMPLEDAISRHYL